jgi:hypothetical protein
MAGELAADFRHLCKECDNKEFDVEILRYLRFR